MKNNNNMEYRAIRAIISGGGTGGHIFPAVSIANKLKELNPETEILFVGAEGRMEMEKVPAAGYRIVGLRIAGIQRRLSPGNIIRNLTLPFKLMSSIRNAGKIIDGFKPDVVIGVGGFASGPLLWAATRKSIPTLIQEQNGFAGLTNKILAKKVGRICVAYDGMEKFFPAEKIIKTGNPIRADIVPATEETRKQAFAHYGMNPEKRHVFVVGGSLGSGTLNNAMKKWISDGCPGGEDVEVLWQCGRYYKEGIDSFMKEAASKGLSTDSIRHSDFIGRMDLAYAMADIVVSRSGASSISELCAAGKAGIYVPSPNVAEDHQTHNAMALVNRGAGILVKDSEAVERLMSEAVALVHDRERIAGMEKNALSLALRDAAATIVDEIYGLI